MALAFIASQSVSEVQVRIYGVGMCTFAVEQKNASNRVFTIKLVSDPYLNNTTSLCT